MPAICYVTKSYIPEIENKEWPELKEDELLAENAEPGFSAKYFAHNSDGTNKITPEPESTDQSVFEPEAHDINPLIFYRLARPPKEGTELPIIDLSKYFEKSEHHGFKIQISPDYTHDIETGKLFALKYNKLISKYSRIDCMNDSLIQKHSDKYGEIKSAIAEFDPKLVGEFNEIYDNQATEIISGISEDR